MKISAAFLRRKGACKDQVDLFKATFGAAPVTVTRARCVEHAGKFDWDWAARNLLPAPLFADYKAKLAPLFADYAAKLAPLVADYEAKRTALFVDYSAKRTALVADYAAKRTALVADYEAKLAPLAADYEAKLAALFCSLAEQV